MPLRHSLARLARFLLLSWALTAFLAAQDESQLAALGQAGDFARARTLIAQLIDREPREPRHRYNLACAEARLGFTELALDALDTAVRLGFKDRDLLLGDEDLARIRDLPRFREIANRVPAAAPIAAPKQVPAPKTQGAGQGKGHRRRRASRSCPPHRRRSRRVVLHDALLDLYQ